MLVLACRGCCCGTAKHPGVDHAAQIEALAEAGARDGIDLDVVVTTCLGRCRWSNVIVAADADTGTQTWFAGVLAEADLAAVVGWLAEPDRHPRPDHLVREVAAPDNAVVVHIAAMAKARRYRGAPT